MELLGVIFCVRFRDVVNNCSMTDLGATEAIPYLCRAGGCRKHCGMFCGFPAGVDGFSPCAQHALNKGTEGNWYRFSPAVSIGEHESRVVLRNGKRQCTWIGTGCRAHKTHEIYKPPAIIYCYRSYVRVLSHTKNLVHKFNFGPIVSAKIFFTGKSPQTSFNYIHFQQRKGNQAFLELLSKFLCLRGAGSQTALF